MNKVRAYITDCYSELTTKVSWPTWGELQSSAIVVLIATAIFGITVFAMDSVFQAVMGMLYAMFK